MKVNESKISVGKDFGRNFLDIDFGDGPTIRSRLEGPPKSGNPSKPHHRNCWLLGPLKPGTGIWATEALPAGMEGQFSPASNTKNLQRPRFVDSPSTSGGSAQPPETWPTVCCAVLKMGVSQEVAVQAGRSVQGWWHHSRSVLNLVLTDFYFDRLSGLGSFNTNFFTPPGASRTPGGGAAPYPDCLCSPILLTPLLINHHIQVPYGVVAEPDKSTPVMEIPPHACSGGLIQRNSCSASGQFTDATSCHA